jgi:hypothetical protein
MTCGMVEKRGPRGYYNGQITDLFYVGARIQRRSTTTTDSYMSVSNPL